MTRPVWMFLAALVIAVPVAYLIHRAAQRLGFLDPPFNAEHRERRTIVASLYALLLTLPLLFFGAMLDWPRIWKYVGIINGMAALVFGVTGTLAAVRLWRLRDPRVRAAQRNAALPTAGPDDPAP